MSHWFGYLSFSASAFITGYFIGKNTEAARALYREDEQLRRHRETLERFASMFNTHAETLEQINKSAKEAR